MGQHSYSCLACLGCSWSPQKELPLWLQTMLGTAILIETHTHTPAQLSSLIPACDHWCQDLCCGLCSFMEHACVAPAHCWVTSPQSMNYASSTQSHDTCFHSNPTLSFTSRAHPPLYGVWVLSQTTWSESKPDLEMQPLVISDFHSQELETQSPGQRGQLFAIFLLPLILPPAAFNPFPL